MRAMICGMVGGVLGTLVGVGGMFLLVKLLESFGVL